MFSNKELPSPQRVLPLSGSTFRAGSDTNLQHSRDINVLISETNELRILIQKLELEKSEMTVRIHHYETLLQSTGSQVQEATEGYKTEIALLRK